ncbi:MAG: ThiJ/PfpI protein [Segetibacter sp.]|nr:ThiJ/PfpI protein [Segetibacter sp.]
MHITHQQVSLPTIMKKCSIREIKSDQLILYKQFLAVGLVDDEQCFCLTPADDFNAPFPTNDKEDSFTPGAYVDETLAGVVSFEGDGKDRQKLRHKGILFGMYVSKKIPDKELGKR